MGALQRSFMKKASQSLCRFHGAIRGFNGALVGLEFGTYLISKNTAVLDMKWCIIINPNIYGIIHTLGHTYRVVFIDT